MLDWNEPCVDGYEPRRSARNAGRPQAFVGRRLLRHVREEGIEIVVCPQVIYELRTVLTRPGSDNGYGVGAAAFETLAHDLVEAATFFPDPSNLVFSWMALRARHDIVGKRSHDARLVAWMEAHGVGTILTLNPRDFRIFRSINVLSPDGT